MILCFSFKTSDALKSVGLAGHLTDRFFTGLKSLSVASLLDSPCPRLNVLRARGPQTRADGKDQGESHGFYLVL